MQSPARKLFSDSYQGAILVVGPPSRTQSPLTLWVDWFFKNALSSALRDGTFRASFCEKLLYPLQTSSMHHSRTFLVLALGLGQESIQKPETQLQLGKILLETLPKLGELTFAIEGERFSHATSLLKPVSQHLHAWSPQS